MSFLNKLFSGLKEELKDFAVDAIEDLVVDDNDKFSVVKYDKLPSNILEFKSLDGMDFKDPVKVVGLSIIALSLYPKNKELCIEALNSIKGPRALSNPEKSFLSDRFRGKDYLINSYFEGTSPDKNYIVSDYSIKVYETKYTNELINEGYKRYFVKSSGADSLREVRLRQKGSTGEWFLWEYFLLTDIRKPDKLDEWA